MFAVGDIVEMFAPSASKTKYHLCVCCSDENGVDKFLFINSGVGYEGDFVLVDGQIHGLPTSKSGKSVISCSFVDRCNQRQLLLFKAKKISELDKVIAKSLAEFITNTKSLTKKDKLPLVNGIATYSQTK